MVFPFGWHLLGALICAAAFIIDMRTRKIPNWLNFTAGSVMTAGVLLEFIRHPQPWIPVLQHALGGLLVPLGMLAPLFVMRALGAGDIKLMMALGILLGPKGAFYQTLFMAMAGGVLAVLVFSYHLGWQGLWGLLRSGGRGLSGYAALKEKFPYSLAIAISYGAVLWWQGLI
jgi:prepilin peptidase CpaA